MEKKRTPTEEAKPEKFFQIEDTLQGPRDMLVVTQRGMGVPMKDLSGHRNGSERRPSRFVMRLSKGKDSVQDK